MSAQRTRETVKAYIDELVSFGDFARYFTDDVTVSFMGTDRLVRGRDAARSLITFMHEQAFKTEVTLKGLACAEQHAMLEAEFVGTHIGEFEGIPASHRTVRVPYSVAYDLAGDRISALRIYFPLELLIKQIIGVAEPVATTAW
jgi:predicted ester cyclase